MRISATGGALGHNFPSTGDWGTGETVSVPLNLKVGTDMVTVDSGDGYAPDIDRIDSLSCDRDTG